MANILNSPGRYVQGAGELSKLGKYAEGYGKKALILISQSGYKRIGGRVETGFAETGCSTVSALPSHLRTRPAVLFLLFIRKKAFLKNICSFPPIRIWFSWIRR